MVFPAGKVVFPASKMVFPAGKIIFPTGRMVLPASIIPDHVTGSMIASVASALFNTVKTGFTVCESASEFVDNTQKVSTNATNLGKSMFFHAFLIRD